MILTKKIACLFLSSFILYVSCSDNPVSSNVDMNQTRVATVSPGLSDILFYKGNNASTESELYKSTGGGELQLLSRYQGWSNDWDIIVPGDFDGDGLGDFLFIKTPAILKQRSTDLQVMVG